MACRRERHVWCGHGFRYRKHVTSKSRTLTFHSFCGPNLVHCSEITGNRIIPSTVSKAQSQVRVNQSFKSLRRNRVKGLNLEMGFAQFMEFEEGGVGSSGALNSFQWGGTIFALILLILNRVGRRSGMQSNLLVMYLFTSFPTVLFKILRGQFGYWVSFLAVSANLFFPQTFPVSRFLLFVVTPTWVANGLRNSLVGGIFCLIIGVLVVITAIQGIGGFSNCQCNCHCFVYCLSIGFIFFFTILYLCSETW